MRPIAISIEVQRALREARSGLWGVGVLTAIIGLFPIALALFLLLLFDVALPGHSGATLVGVYVVLIIIFGFYLVLSGLRRRMFAQLGEVILGRLGNRIDASPGRLMQLIQSPQHGGETIADLDAIERFLASRAAPAWCDMAAVPLYLLVMIFFHGWLALALLVAVLLFVGLLRRALRPSIAIAGRLAQLTAERDAITTLTRTQGDLVRALGMRERISRSWRMASQILVRTRRKSNDRDIAFSEGADGLLYLLLASILAIGGWLAINDLASTGILVSAAVLALFSLRPFARAIELVPEMTAAQRGWWRLDERLDREPPPPAVVELPQPSATLDCEGVVLVPPGSERPVLRNINFSLAAGEVLAVIGGGGTGKSALLRALAGAWSPVQGHIRLDGGALDQWDSDDLARHIGYMPEHGGLMSGSVAENIARFDPDARPEAIVDAARRAGAHELILRLSDGYGSTIGSDGAGLSQSQGRRIALARALYGNPFLIILDQPAAHIDMEGEKALARAVGDARERGAIVVLGGSDRILVEIATSVLILRNGIVAEFGPKEEVRARAEKARSRIEN